MKLGILGGTGNMGRGLALRWALKHDVLIGSRSLDKACDAASEQESRARGFYQDQMQGSINGALNCTAAKESEIIVVTLPPSGLIQTVTEAAKFLRRDQIVVSTVVSMNKNKGLFSYVPLPMRQMKKYLGKSAAEIIQSIVKPLPVVSAFQTVPAAYLENVDSIMNIDVLVAGDDKNAITCVSNLIMDIANLRPLRVGALANSTFLESLTPLLLNVAILNKLHEPSIRIVPWMPKSFVK